MDSGPISFRYLDSCSMGDTYFDVLQVIQGATESEIREAYQRQRVLHRANSVQLRRIDQAYAVLANPIRRAQYLQQLQSHSPPQTEAPAGDSQAAAAPSAQASPAPVLRKDVSESQDLRKKTSPTEPLGSDDVHDALDKTQSVSRPLTSSAAGYHSRRSVTELIDSVQSGGTPQDLSQSGNVRDPIRPKSPHRLTELLGDEQVISSSWPRSGRGDIPQRGPRPTEYLASEQDQPTPALKREESSPRQANLNRAAYNQAADALSMQASADQASAPPDRESVPNQPKHKRVAQPQDLSAIGEIRPPYVCIKYRDAIPEVRLQIQSGKNVIGRPSKDKQPELPLSDSQMFVSREHAIINWNDPDCTVTDMSRNGTWLNGQRLVRSRSYPLHDGDIIIIEEREITVHLTQG